MGVVLAVDAMGGDLGPAVTLPACRQFLERHADARLLLVGQPQALGGFAHERASVVSASEVVAMDDAVEVALRRKKDSSMRVAIAQVKSGAAQAAVSAGNTGALMAIARYLLRTMEGIGRPAIATQIPNVTGGATTVLDLGANVDCTAAHLLQFAVMGSALVSALEGRAQPSVGLLNIGEEAIKGGETIKRAGALLRAAAEQGDLNFIGNVEGNDIFHGSADIVVCDGFVGNVALKTTEGLAAMLTQFMREEFARTQTPHGSPPLQRCGAAGTARAGVQKPRQRRRTCFRTCARSRLGSSAQRVARARAGAHRARRTIAGGTAC